MADYQIKKGDTRPIFSDTLTYSDGTAANLTGATVKFVMRAITAASPVTNATATIVTAASGTVSYTPNTTDTATAGAYQAEWHVTFGDASTMTFPTDGYLEVIIEEELVSQSSTGRLLGLGEVKDVLNIPASDRTHDAELLRYIDAATPIVESIVGPVLSATYDEWYSGGATEIVLRHRPVISITSIVEYSGNTAYTLTADATPDVATSYSYSTTVGRVLRRGGGGAAVPFAGGSNNVRIIYVAGRASIPGNIKLATLELIRVNYEQTQQGGRPAAFGAGAAVDELDGGSTLMGFFVPNRVRELLAPNRRFPSMA